MYVFAPMHVSHANPLYIVWWFLEDRLKKKRAMQSCSPATELSAASAAWKGPGTCHAVGRKNATPAVPIYNSPSQ